MHFMPTVDIMERTILNATTMATMKSPMKKIPKKRKRKTSFSLWKQWIKKLSILSMKMALHPARELAKRLCLEHWKL